MKDFSKKVALGRTDLHVSRVGVGASYGVSEKACRKAFDMGVNYFFWGSVRTSGMGVAIRDIARTHREELVIVLECYARHPKLIGRSVEQGLRKLEVGYADILLLGWHDKIPRPGILDTVKRLKDEGLYRYLGISSHKRPLFQQYLEDGWYDVFHVRYNAAHRGAEQDIFPYLPKRERPGIVSFTNTRWGGLLKAKNMPPGFSPPSASECYRFALSNPHVDVAICGPKNDGEMEAAQAVLAARPMDEEELQSMCRIGDHVHNIRSIMSFLSE
jgi:aryl-alcohol dehydrogenase-like predicted oxidoreductase